MVSRCCAAGNNKYPPSKRNRQKRDWHLINMILDRIPCALFSERLPELIKLGRPAIVTELFRGQPLEQISDRQKVGELLGTTKVTISQNYINANLERVRNYQSGIRAPKELGRTPGTFAQYMDLIARDPASRCAVCEEPTPSNLLDGIDLHTFGIDTVVGGCRNATPLNPAPSTTANSLMFVANGGNSSDLHADGDGRDVLLYQGFGRKRVVLFPSEAAPRLHPIANYSTVPIARMDEAERTAFITYAGGVEHVLIPGEALFMPAFIWHHFDYLDLSMSISFRFGGISDPEAQALLRTVHLDHYTQNIIVGTRDPARAELCQTAARRLCAAVVQSYPSTREQFRTLRALAAECHRSTLLPGSRPYLSGIIEAEEFLDGGLSGYYSKPPNGSALYRGLWWLQENIRDLLRRWGRKLAYWA